MAFARDPYYQALFERLRERVQGVPTWSRRWLHFSKLPASTQPACILLATTQEARTDRGFPRIWVLGADIVLYVRATGQEGSLDTVLNELIDAVEAALLRDEEDTYVGPFFDSAGPHTTLGGLVHELAIAGPIELNQAEGGEQAMAVIPIDMLVLGDG